MTGLLPHSNQLHDIHSKIIFENGGNGKPAFKLKLILMRLLCQNILLSDFRCKAGHFGMLGTDPLGCKKCYCSSHSSECTLGLFVNNMTVPASQPELDALADPDKVMFSCPEGTSQCDVCLKQGKLLVSTFCSFGRLTFEQKTMHGISLFIDYRLLV